MYIDKTQPLLWHNEVLLMCCLIYRADSECGHHIYSICATGVPLFLDKNQRLNRSNSAAMWYQKLCFTQTIKTQACQAKEVHHQITKQ